MLIKKGVSIPSVARLMRHKDGGGLLLKKYTQGFEEEMRRPILNLDSKDRVDDAPDFN